MAKISETVRRWRREGKEHLIKCMGGRCVICSYNRCSASLEFHHLDPNEKDFTLGSIWVTTKKWPEIANELRKCVLLCSNCHKEVHAGISEVPSNAERFDENSRDFRRTDEDRFNECPICKGKKKISSLTCSAVCAGRKAETVKWDRYDLKDLYSRMNMSGIGDLVGCSDSAVRKRLIKLGLYKRTRGTNKA